MNDKVVTRFAPSPTGYLHLGHAYSALLNYDRAVQSDGRFLLRIEDIDFGRCKPECEAAIYEDLKWLGLTWEEPVRRQSDRMDIYENALKDLQSRGLVYRCFKTRKDIEEAMSAPHALGTAYTGAPDPLEAEKLARDLPYAWRLSMAAAIKQTGPVTWREEMDDGSITGHNADPATVGDVVLARKDIGTSYHLACVTDDADQGVTLVIRGHELRDIAGLHAILFTLFGKPSPVFRHHKHILDDSGNRLAKRDASMSLRHMRANGVTPADIHARLQT